MKPALIIIGGFAGTGKTAVSERLSAELQIPRLGSDTIGRTIKKSLGAATSPADAYRIAYDVLFRLCEEFVQRGVSAVLDLTMGWESQWQNVDGIVQRHPKLLFLPIILRCSHEECMERIRQRHEADREYYDPPVVYRTEPKNIRIWEYLANLDRRDIHFVDAGRPQDEVYDEVRGLVTCGIGEAAGHGPAGDAAGT